jgi:threonine dehydrogenase-like Zn-dependent dehydrogenase
MSAAGDVRIENVPDPRVEEPTDAVIRITRASICGSGGPAPVRAYIDELLPDVLEGRIEPGRVFDRVADLGVPEGYRAMNERQSIKVLVEP